MKKIIVVLAIGSLALASCKKTYVCECRSTKPNVDGWMYQEVETNQKNKQDAVEWCSSGDIDDMNLTQICEIK